MSSTIFRGVDPFDVAPYIVVVLAGLFVSPAHAQDAFSVEDILMPDPRNGDIGQGAGEESCRTRAYRIAGR